MLAWVSTQCGLGILWLHHTYLGHGRALSPGAAVTPVDVYSAMPPESGFGSLVQSPSLSLAGLWCNGSDASVGLPST